MTNCGAMASVRGFMMVVIVMFLGVSCMPCRRISTPKSTITDSVTIELRRRVVEHTESLYIDLPHYCDRVLIVGDTSVLENPYAHSQAIITPQGELFHTLSLLAQKIGTEHSVTIEVRDSVVWRERVTTNIVEVERELTAWQKIQIKGFWLVVVIMSGGVMVRRIIG